MHRRLVFLILLACLVGCYAGPAAQTGAPAGETSFDVSAKAALLMEPQSGTVLYAKNTEARLPPASITKVMTLLLIMEAVDAGRVSLRDEITASATAAGLGGSQVFLKEGERIPLEKMLIAIAVESANDASTAVAEHLYTTEEDFVRVMNTRARELGMTNTHFTNAHGLPDQDHYMSATDIATVSRELIMQHPRILKYTSIWTYTFRPGITELRNTNELIHTYRGADGLKTGHTREAGWSLVGTAKRGDLRLLSVVMGTDSNATRLRETKRLLDYGFRNFERKVIARKGQDLGHLAIRDGWPGKVKVVAPQDIVTIIPRGKSRLYTMRLAAREGVRAPLKQGAVVGEVEILTGGKVVGRQPAVTAAPVGRANFIVRGWRALLRWIGGLFGR